MKCDEVNALLDRWMDDELTDEQIEQLQAHEQQCPECAPAIRAGRQLRALLAQAEPEEDVPLQAQARWRGAVRQESRRQRNRRVIRRAASMAAAIVVLAGVGLSLNYASLRQRRGADEAAGIVNLSEGAEQSEAYEAGTAPEAPAGALTANSLPLKAPAAQMDDAVVIEADGAAEYEAGPEAVEEEAPVVIRTGTVEEEAVFEAVEGTPAVELSMRVEDVDFTCDRICDLAEEYEGSAQVQKRSDGAANVFVQLDAENAEDFFRAVLPMDTSDEQGEVPAVSRQGLLLVLIEVGK